MISKTKTLMWSKTSTKYFKNDSLFKKINTFSYICIIVTVFIAGSIIIENLNAVNEEYVNVVSKEQTIVFIDQGTSCIKILDYVEMLSKQTPIQC